MREILLNLNEHILHKKSFHSIKEELNLCFNNYTNKKTIIDLLEFWIYSIRALHITYGLESVKMYLRGKQKDIFIFAVSLEFGSDLTKSSPLKKRYKNNWLLKLDKYLSIEHRLPGTYHKSYLNIILVKYTMHLLMQISTSYDKKLACNVIDIISLYFSRMNLLVDKNDILLGLPDIFKSMQINQKYHKESKIHCAPIELFQFRGHENIFLLKKKLKVYGYQHGGGYDIFNGDILTDFEKKISSRFFGWGLSKENIHQKSFRKRNSLLSRTSSDKKIVWVESPREPKIYSLFYPIQYYIKRDVKIIYYINTELKEYGGQYYKKPYPGILKSNLCDNIKSDIINGKPEDFLRKGDLVIFDNCFHSLIFHCIENKILFIIISNRNIKQYYTKNTTKWMSVLRRNGLFFFSDEKSNLASRIKNLDFNFIFPIDVIEYHKLFFQQAS